MKLHVRNVLVAGAGIVVIIGAALLVWERRGHGIAPKTETPIIDTRSTTSAEELAKPTGVSEKLISEKTERMLVATSTEKVAAPSSPVPTKAEVKTVSKRDELAQKCADFSIGQAREVLKGPLSKIPLLDPRVRQISAQSILFSPEKNICYISVMPFTDDISTTTIFDVFGGRVLATYVYDFNAPARMTNTDPESSCVILGKSGCSNQEFIDYQRELMRDGTDGGGSMQLTSPDFHYKVIFPQTPYLLAASSTSAENGARFEYWGTRLGEDEHFLLVSWKFDSPVSSVLDLSKPLEWIVEKLYEGIKTEDPDVKLVSNYHYRGDDQVNEFTIDSEQHKTRGIAFFKGGNAFVLARTCTKVCSDVRWYGFLDSFESN
jgi:hypothetical protein